MVSHDVQPVGSRRTAAVMICRACSLVDRSHRRSLALLLLATLGRGLLGASMSAACLSYQAFHSAYGSAFTRAYMFAWLRPHSSAHWPCHSPRSVTLNQVLFV